MEPERTDRTMRKEVPYACIAASKDRGFLQRLRHPVLRVSAEPPQRLPYRLKHGLLLDLVPSRRPFRLGCIKVRYTDGDRSRPNNCMFAPETASIFVPTCLILDF